MTGKMFKMCAIGAAVTGLIALTTLDAQAAVTYRTVAMSTNTFLDTPENVIFGEKWGATGWVFYTPVINSVGQTAFGGTLIGPGIDSTNDRGVWSEGSGTLKLVARAGDPTPGTSPGNVFSRSFFDLVLNETGQTIFRSVYTGSSSGYGIWKADTDTLKPVAIGGDQAPGTPPRVTLNVTSFVPNVGMPVINNTTSNAEGKTVFLDTLSGYSSHTGLDYTNNLGLWSDRTGELSLVVRKGDTGPGMLTNQVYGGIGFPVINDSSQIAFRGAITRLGSYPTLDIAGIWSDVSGDFKLIVSEGRDAPGVEAGIKFGSEFFYSSLFRLSDPVINDAGQIAFRSALRGPTITQSNDLSIWLSTNGLLRPIVREGDPAPGVEKDILFGDLSIPILSGSGETIFLAALTGPGVDSTNDFGIWLEDNGSLKLIAREGDAAPGTPDGMVFTRFGFGTALAINKYGQIAFTEYFSGGLGIWATDRSGRLRLIAKTGDLFDVNDDPQIEDFRTISSIAFTAGSGGEDGRPTGFNDSGQLAFQLFFTDYTEGIFVATIPEPATLVVFVVGAGLILGKR